jgi:hypothetical protein
VYTICFIADFFISIRTKHHQQRNNLKRDEEWDEGRKETTNKQISKKTTVQYLWLEEPPMPSQREFYL